MYNVSQAYLDKLFSVGAKRRHISGTLNGVAFDENDIVLNSCKYSKQAVGSSDIKLGGVFLSQLTMTFTRAYTQHIQWGEWDKSVITLSIGLEVAANTIEYVPVGIYIVSEADHNASGVSITAYDHMAKFDKSLSVTTTAGSIYSLLNYCCKKCGVTLGMTKEEVEALPNGNEVVSEYPDNDMTYYRDLVSWIAVTCCAFATIDREGRLVLVNWDDDITITLGINDRFEGGSFSDFVTRYTGCSFGNIADQTTSYIHVIPDNGLTMTVGMNPLMQYGLAETKARMQDAILQALQKFNYSPFKVSAFADPCFDLGDVIQFTGGLAGTRITSCIMRMDFQYTKGMTLQGYGKNPSLFGAQSKTDKNLAGLMAQTQANETKFEVYTNADQLDCAERMGSRYYLWNIVDLCSLNFACSKDTVVEVNTTAKLRFFMQYGFTAYNRVPFIDHIKLKFYIDDEQIDEWRYTPLQFYGNPSSSAEVKVMWNTFEIPISHYFPILNVKGGEVKNLKVAIDFGVPQMRYRAISEGVYEFQVDDMNEGHLYIDAGDLMVTLRGQGLVIEKPWDGFIIVEDTTTPVSIGGMDNEELDDTTTVTVIVPLSVNLSDSVELHEMAGLQLDDVVDNAPQIMLARPKRNIITIRSGNLINIDETKNFTTI